MSTKIYDAYRIPICRRLFNVTEFTRLFNKICLKSVIGFLKKYPINEKTIKETRKQLFGRQRKLSNSYTDGDIVLIYQLSEWMYASKKGYNDIYHMDCSFNMWMDGEWAYVIPYVANGINMRKLLPKWCEYYGYWNNSDPEEGISEEEWEERGAIWAKVATDDWNSTRFTHTTFEMKLPYMNGVANLLNALKGDREGEWEWRIRGSAEALFHQKEEKAEKDAEEFRRRV